MPIFKYKASSPGGTVGEYEQEASSPEDAARRLRQKGLFPMALLEESRLRSQHGHAGFLRHRFSAVDFTERLVPLLTAGIPLEQALNLIAEEKGSSALTEMAQLLRKGLHEGKKFSSLLREQKTAFSPMYASVVEAGEEAGALPQVMQELQKFLTESSELKSFLISAAIYPAFLLVTGVCMLGFIFGVILPKFATTLAGTGIRSQATEILLGCAGLFRDLWWLFPVFLAALFLLVHWIRKPGTMAERQADRWILHIPILGKLVLWSNLSRFAKTMAILMRNGVHLLSTVQIAGKVLQNTAMRFSLQNLGTDLRQGKRLSAALSQSPYIPPLMRQMLAVGEETGAVDNMLEHVAIRYENDLKKGTRRVLNLLEPVIIILLGMAVAAVVVLMFLAILDMQNVAR